MVSSSSDSHSDKFSRYNLRDSRRCLLWKTFRTKCVYTIYFYKFYTSCCYSLLTICKRKPYYRRYIDN